MNIPHIDRIPKAIPLKLLLKSVEVSENQGVI